MQRITITIDDELLDTVDALVAARGYATRSEAIRDLVRRGALDATTSGDETPCVGVLGYVYDHETRAMAQRLSSTFHAHHGLTVASMHIHLSHEACLEVAVVKGPQADIRNLADSVASQRGVRHANLHLVPETEGEIATRKKGHSHG
ncbi:nickel-responsive transcriptional regulator NikR [Chelatococcus reniformis]|uniref:Putative nickel-responsive regulator n=1 Tax=Chelatococcus reniformis TaxID=1494448 RepID=A0A916UW56_9HYPH|nr:nickel-responsive transcriptional regulator NikR [Chelatococcus reniformis]GGC87992.1 nickel-responsive regulator [Chelatococcus reniformis]